MCLIFLSYKTTPGYPLLVVANRDEFLQRPTAPLGYLDREEKVLGGRDLQGGGTWLGIDSRLRFAAITNFRSPKEFGVDKPSRGALVLDYLSESVSAHEYGQRLAGTGHNYNGFNLFYGDLNNLYYYSNKIGRSEKLKPGFYGLSNHLLDTPWPKVKLGKSLLAPYVSSRKIGDPSVLLKILTNRERPADKDLPDTGVGLEWERLLSSIFIDGSNYGTRSSSLIRVSNQNVIEFTEVSYFRSDDSKIETEIITKSLSGEGSVTV